MHYYRIPDAAKKYDRSAALPPFIPVLLLVILAAALRILVFREPLNAEFALLRMIERTASGAGLDYGTVGQTLIPYPVAPLIGVLLVRITGFDLLSVIPVTIGAVLIFVLLDRRWLSALIYVVAAMIFPSTAAALLIVWVFSALLAARGHQWLLAGLFSAFAILTDPAGIALIPLLILMAVRSTSWRNLWLYLCPAVGVPLVVFMVLIRQFPAPLRLMPLTDGTFVIMLIALVMVPLIRYRVALRTSNDAIVLVLWTLSALLIAFISHAPIGLINDLVDRQVAASWLYERTNPQDKIAMMDIGATAYYSGRTVVPFGIGALHPNLDQAFFVSFMPEAVIVSDSDVVQWEPFKSTYARQGTFGRYTIYQRAVAIAPMMDHPVTVNFNGTLNRVDLSLSNAAISNTIKAGQFIPLRLDWTLRYIPAFDVVIEAKLVDSTGNTLTSVRDTLPSDRWHEGTQSTFHYMVLPPTVSDGAASLWITITVRGDLGTAKVLDLNVQK